MEYTPSQLREWAEAISSGNWPMFGHEVASAFIDHAAKIEECERLRKALEHQRTALMIVRDRQSGSASVKDLNKGIALIDAALKGE